ncbi:MAG: DNRLRE domain-containing protein [Syntrophomonadaceae bacterium]|nr:DNRLRE domain-containing protein [Syntrophomonadaceae bacterium]
MPVLTVPAAIDAFVSEYYPNKNFVLSDTDNDTLFLGRFTKPGDVFRSLLKFDLGELSNNPAFNMISAYLQLHICRNEVPSGTIEVKLYRLVNTWNPAWLTWNSQPFAYHNPDQSFIIPAQWEGMMMVEVSSTVKGWLNGDFVNYGLLIKGNEEQNSIVGIRSSNYNDPAAHPQLKILFESPGSINGT